MDHLTRRALLRGSAVAAAAATVTVMPIVVEAALPDPDPVLEAWRQWRPLAEEAARLIVERDRIVEALPDWAFLPSTWGSRPGGAPIHSAEFYDDWASAGGDPERQKRMRDGRPNFLRLQTHNQ